MPPPAAAPAPSPRPATPAHPATPDAPGRRRRPARRSRSLVLLTCLLAVLALVGTGCVRVRAGLAVSPDDRVSGRIDIATPAGSPDGSGPPLQVPSDLSGDVELTRYEQDGYVGTRVTFTDLSFDEVSRVLPEISPTTTSAVRLQLRRAGSRVVLSGRVDLTRVSAESSDVQLKIAFPGPVTQTDGTDAGGVVSWTFRPGSVGEVNAVADYEDPNAPSWISWALLLLAIVAVAVGVVVWLAASSRTPSRTRSRR